MSRRTLCRRRFLLWGRLRCRRRLGFWRGVGLWRGLGRWRFGAVSLLGVVSRVARWCDMNDAACRPVDGRRRWTNGPTRPVDRPVPVGTPPEERCLGAIRPDDAGSAPRSVHPACDVIVPGARAELRLDEVDPPP